MKKAKTILWFLWNNSQQSLFPAIWLLIHLMQKILIYTLENRGSLQNKLQKLRLFWEVNQKVHEMPEIAPIHLREST